MQLDNTVRPPIFSIQPTGTDAQQHLHRARQFRAAAEDLPDSRNGEQNWPKYALLTHAIELALKGFVLHCAQGGKIPGDPKRHNLVEWYEAAVKFGLTREPVMTENITLLNNLHESHYMRYPAQGARLVPNPETIADQTVDHLVFEITQVVNPR
jgi:hypothetical protein